MSPTRFWILGTVIIMLTSMVGAAGLAWWQVRSRIASAHLPSTLPADDRQLVLDLTDHRGVPVRAEGLRGKHVLLYFGYTFCPDVCPTELGFLHRILTALGPDAEKIDVFFVTIDPERDTAAVLADYVPHFDPRIRGLHGDATAIKAAADSVGAVYSRSTPVEAPPGFYLMNHSMAAFLIDPQGRPVATYRSSDGVETAVGDLRRRLGDT